jgi:glutaredoxin
MTVEILLLTQEDCAFCDQAKEILARLSGEYGFAVRALRLDSAEGQALAEEGGVLFAPGVFIDGAPFSYGRLSERKLRRQLERRP